MLYFALVLSLSISLKLALSQSLSLSQYNYRFPWFEEMGSTRHASTPLLATQPYLPSFACQTLSIINSHYVHVEDITRIPRLCVYVCTCVCVRGGVFVREWMCVR